MSDNCFHCHQIIPADFASPRITVKGADQQFCCLGCHAVCQAICDANLEEYYHYRTSVDIQTAVVPDFLEQYQIYDDPGVQQSFVQDSGNHKEAFLLIENIHCAACYWLNEKHVLAQPGVIEAVIDISSNKMRVVWDPLATSLSAILAAIADIGYIAYPYDAKQSRKLEKLKKRRSLERLLFSGIIGMAIMEFSLATYLLNTTEPDGSLSLWVSAGRITTLIATLAILLYPAQDFFIGAYTDLKHKRIGMDMPIVFGLSAAFFGSVHTMLIGHGEVYFDSIAMFVFFILLARHWEFKARRQATATLDKLTLAIPQYTERLSDGQWQKTPLIDIHINDVVRIKPGETVTVDGVIIAGSSSFDESILTGESLPIHKTVGDPVISGATNHEQIVQIQVEKTGPATTVNTMNNLINRALETRPALALSIDKIAQWFIPIILLLACSTAWYWWQAGNPDWLAHTIAVLIVTCPCALALATPIALTIGMHRLVSHGIIPVNMARIETLANTDTIAFDKTGTLSEGKISLTDTLHIEPAQAKQNLAMAASLAQHSEHVIAKAIAQVSSDSLTLEAVKNHVGQGVSCTYEGKVWRLGSLAFVSTQQDHPVLLSYHSVSALSCDGVIACYFSFEDQIRPDATPLITALQDKQLYILSGDHKHSVAQLAAQVGVQHYHHSMLPNEKLQWVRRQQQDGHTVLMIGDGVNDAPTLAAADVSVSFSEAADLAKSNSDFIISNAQMRTVQHLLNLAVRIRRIIRQNLAWAILYNLIAVPLAILGLVPPYVAAIGMSASSLLVVLNALRINH